MISLSSDVLHQICPGTAVAVLARFVDPLLTVWEEREVTMAKRQAGFLSQFAHETQGFTRLEENLHYSAAGLVGVFPKYFSQDEAEDFANQPERIANRVYADRMGNGDEDSGDGWLFRGRGLPHLTGRANYERGGQALNLDIVESPDLLLQPEYAVAIGGWFWHVCRGNDFSDAGDVRALTHTVNGGYNGLDSRIKYYERALQALTTS